MKNINPMYRTFGAYYTNIYSFSFILKVVIYTDEKEIKDNPVLELKKIFSDTIETFYPEKINKINGRTYFIFRKIIFPDCQYRIMLKNNSIKFHIEEWKE